jgi:hypothetical protein
MKKITLLLVLFLTIQLNAQVLTQNFDTTLGWTVSHLSGSSTNLGWTRVTAGTNPNCAPYSGAGMAKYATYDVPAGNVNVLTSPGFTLSGANSYRVIFHMYRDNGYNTDNDNISVYLSPLAGSNGSTLLGTVNRSMTLSPVVSTEGWYTYSFDFPAGTTGTRYLRFNGYSNYGNNIFIDDISVVQIVSNDAMLSQLNQNSTIVAGTPQTISGSFTNAGSNVINTATINWQLDSGAVYSQNLTGLNLAANQTYNFSHNTQWNPTPGVFSLKVWVSNPNGVTDNNLSNNEIIKSVSVASNSTTRLPLYEKFSSSTCGPCYTFNTNYFNGFYNTNSTGFALIDYQVNWPGSGDPYYTAEVGTRRAFYGVNAAPTLFVDAIDGTNFDSAGLTSDFNNAASKPAYFALTAAKSLVGTTMTVNVTTTPYLDGTYRLYVAVVEKTTTGNVASNGETSFKNVLMKMMPDASGTVINCTHDVPVTTQITTNLAGTFIEQYTDLDVIVFVQNYATKEIMQSMYVSQILGNQNFSASNIKVYPNPSTGLITIDSQDPMNIEVTDLTGKTVYTAKEINNQAPLNLSFLQKGVYLVKMSNGEVNQTQKIIIK